ncbi:hypothetical protein [Thalassoroseus pseudoceratinae]|uniref:hypothetical protein n=1 Tax=Thalassoroseus pseudoceratinae TaxID=2713176 RepID=UPI00141F076C|nr:hypothetical protein [Thalassoroseus pseudoceratinae]
MFSPEFRRFLRSGDAFQIHLLFGGLTVVLVVGLLTDDRQPDLGWGLLFAVVAWPIVLGLAWLGQKSDEKFVADHIAESISAPRQLLQKRCRWRLISLGFLLVVGLACVFAGHHGWEFESLPAYWLGYLLLLIAGLGAVGVNVWYGGPLDPRFDPSLTDEDLVADPEFTTEAGLHDDHSRPDQ